MTRTLPQDAKDEILKLLKKFGSFKDLRSLADYLGVEVEQIKDFLKSARATKAAKAFAPGERKKHEAELRQAAQEAPAAAQSSITPAGADKIYNILPGGDLYYAVERCRTKKTKNQD